MKFVMHYGGKLFSTDREDEIIAREAALDAQGTPHFREVSYGVALGAKVSMPKAVAVSAGVRIVGMELKASTVSGTVHGLHGLNAFVATTDKDVVVPTLSLMIS